MHNFFTYTFRVFHMRFPHLHICRCGRSIQYACRKYADLFRICNRFCFQNAYKISIDFETLIIIASKITSYTNCQMYIIGNHFLKGQQVAKWFIFLAPAQRNWMQPILLSYEAPFRSSLQKTRGPVSSMQRTGPNINCHFCYAQSSDKLNKKKSKWKHPASWHEMGLIFFDFHKAEYLENGAALLLSFW